MKKIIAFIALTISSYSCSKEAKKCWTCQLTGPSGTQTRDTCTNSDPSNFHFVDNQGFNMSHTCVEK